MEPMVLRRPLMARVRRGDLDVRGDCRIITITLLVAAILGVVIFSSYPGPGPKAAGAGLLANIQDQAVSFLGGHPKLESGPLPVGVDVDETSKRGLDVEQAGKGKRSKPGGIPKDDYDSIEDGPVSAKLKEKGHKKSKLGDPEDGTVLQNELGASLNADPDLDWVSELEREKADGERDASEAGKLSGKKSIQKEGPLTPVRKRAEGKLADLVVPGTRSRNATVPKQRGKDSGAVDQPERLEGLEKTIEIEEDSEVEEEESGSGVGVLSRLNEKLVNATGGEEGSANSTSLSKAAAGFGKALGNASALVERVGNVTGKLGDSMVNGTGFVGKLLNGTVVSERLANLTGSAGKVLNTTGVTGVLANGTAKLLNATGLSGSLANLTGGVGGLLNRTGFGESLANSSGLAGKVLNATGDVVERLSNATGLGRQRAKKTGVGAGFLGEFASAALGIEDAGSSGLNTSCSGSACPALPAIRSLFPEAPDSGTLYIGPDPCSFFQNLNGSGLFGLEPLWNTSTETKTCEPFRTDSVSPDELPFAIQSANPSSYDLVIIADTLEQLEAGEARELISAVAQVAAGPVIVAVGSVKQAKMKPGAKQGLETATWWVEAFASEGLIEARAKSPLMERAREELTGGALLHLVQSMAANTTEESAGEVSQALPLGRVSAANTTEEAGAEDEDEELDDDLADTDGLTAQGGASEERESALPAKNSTLFQNGLKPAVKRGATGRGKEAQFAGNSTSEKRGLKPVVERKRSKSEKREDNGSLGNSTATKEGLKPGSKSRKEKKMKSDVPVKESSSTRKGSDSADDPLGKSDDNAVSIRNGTFSVKALKPAVQKLSSSEKGKKPGVATGEEASEALAGKEGPRGSLPGAKKGVLQKKKGKKPALGLASRAREAALEKEGEELQEALEQEALIQELEPKKEQGDLVTLDGSETESGVTSMDTAEDRKALNKRIPEVAKRATNRGASSLGVRKDLEGKKRRLWAI